MKRLLITVEPVEPEHELFLFASLARKPKNRLGPFTLSLVSHVFLIALGAAIDAPTGLAGADASIQARLLEGERYEVRWFDFRSIADPAGETLEELSTSWAGDKQTRLADSADSDPGRAAERYELDSSARDEALPDSPSPEIAALGPDNADIEMFQSVETLRYEAVSKTPQGAGPERSIVAAGDAPAINAAQAEPADGIMGLLHRLPVLRYWLSDGSSTQPPGAGSELSGGIEAPQVAAPGPGVGATLGTLQRVDALPYWSPDDSAAGGVGGRPGPEALDAGTAPALAGSAPRPTAAAAIAPSVGPLSYYSDGVSASAGTVPRRSALSAVAPPAGSQTGGGQGVALSVDPAAFQNLSKLRYQPLGAPGGEGSRPQRAALATDRNAPAIGLSPTGRAGGGAILPTGLGPNVGPLRYGGPAGESGARSRPERAAIAGTGTQGIPGGPLSGAAMTGGAPGTVNVVPGAQPQRLRYWAGQSSSAAPVRRSSVASGGPAPNFPLSGNGAAPPPVGSHDGLLLGSAPRIRYRASGSAGAAPKRKALNDQVAPRMNTLGLPPQGKETVGGILAKLTEPRRPPAPRARLTPPESERYHPPALIEALRELVNVVQSEQSGKDHSALFRSTRVFFPLPASAVDRNSN